MWSSSTAIGKWRPGLTGKGEKILAKAPFEVEDVSGKPTMTRCKFVVEKQGQKNRIVFEDSVNMGERATCGYLDLPESEKVDIRSEKSAYTSRGRKGYIKIIGVTPEPSQSFRMFPPIAVAAEYDYGVLITNRSGWRAIFKSKADRMIEDFLLDRGLDIPWQKLAERPGFAWAIAYCDKHKTPSRTAGLPIRSSRSREPERARRSRPPSDGL